MRRFLPKIEILREMQRQFQRHTGVRDFSARGRRLARHLPRAGAHAHGRAGRLHPGDRQPHLHGRRQQRADLGSRRHRVRGAGSLRLHPGRGARVDPLRARRRASATNVTAKDLMLHILLRFAKPQATLNRVMEFTGPGVSTLSMDERATLANMATECTARERHRRGRRGDLPLARRPGARAPTSRRLRARAVEPDAGAEYAGGVHTHRPRRDPADGRPSGRSRPRHRLRSDQRRAGRGRSARCRSTSPTAAAAPPARSTTCSSTTRSRRKRSTPACGWRRASSSSSSAARSRSNDYAREHGFFETFERAGVRLIRPGLRRLHRLRPGCLGDLRTGDGLGDQPQLQGPERSRQALAGEPADRRRLGLHRPHHRLHAGDVRATTAWPVERRAQAVKCFRGLVARSEVSVRQEDSENDAIDLRVRRALRRGRVGAGRGGLERRRAVARDRPATT